MEITVEVTQDNIDNGKQRKCRECPIALALHDVFLDSDVVVGEGIVFEDPEDGAEQRIPLPAEALKFIKDFDEGFPVRPFVFTIHVPETALLPEYLARYATNPRTGT